MSSFESVTKYAEYFHELREKIYFLDETDAMARDQKYMDLWYLTLNIMVPTHLLTFYHGDLLSQGKK